MNLQPGDPIVATFDSREHTGHVEKVGAHGWHLCRLQQDPTNDYTGIQPPETTLKSISIEFSASVRETDIRKAQ